MSDVEPDTSHREIRVRLPMDARLFGELCAVIDARWPGTMARGEQGGLVLTIPEGDWADD